MKLKNLIEHLIARVPNARRPRPLSSETLLKCGSSGRLVQSSFLGERRAWGLYEQTGHSIAVIIAAETPIGLHIALTTQWQPTDTQSVELPSSNTSFGTERFIEEVLGETRAEVGDIEVVSIQTCFGFSSDPSRKTMPRGGPSATFPIVIQVKCTGDAKPPLSGNGTRKIGRFYPVEEVAQLVRDRRIADMATCFFLLTAGIITAEDFSWIDI